MREIIELIRKHPKMQCESPYFHDCNGSIHSLKIRYSRTSLVYTPAFPDNLEKKLLKKLSSQVNISEQ